MKKCLVPVILLVIWIAAVVVATTRGDEWNKKTVVTFNEPVQVQGMVLAARSYVFEFLDSGGDQKILQIFNADQSQIITTITAIPESHDGIVGGVRALVDKRPSANVLLRLGLGHMAGTLRSGEGANVSITGHCDTFFRKMPCSPMQKTGRDVQTSARQTKERGAPTNHATLFFATFC